MRLSDCLEYGAERGGARPALIGGEQSLSWAFVRQRVERIAAALSAAGVKAGDHIGVLSPNDADAFCAVLGALRLGGVWIPINARTTSQANLHWLRVSECQCIFYHSELEAEAKVLHAALQAPALMVCIDREGDGVPSLEQFIAEPHPAAPEAPDQPDVLASLFATGGTTGLAKAAPWSLQIWESIITSFWRLMPMDGDVVHLCAAPATHAAGVLALCALAGGGTNVLLKKADPQSILQAIEAHRVTHLYVPPTLLYAMLDQPNVKEFDTSSLRYLLVAAAPVAPAKLREAIKVFGNVICQCYGQAEVPMFISFLSTSDLLRGDEARWRSCGRSNLGLRVAIMDETGNLCGPGKRGEIVVRGSLVIPSYYKNPEASAAVRRAGWHCTGDIGFRDADGFLYIVDRKKDMIITGGFNVFSSEVEHVILSHPAVQNCAVIGVPDAKWGEAIKAIVQIKTGAAASEEELISLVKEGLGSVHAPKTVEFWEELPRSPAGKVLKRVIRDRYWAESERQV